MHLLILILGLVVCCGPAWAMRSVTIDPAFAYYKDRSAESVVEELRAAGFGDVRIVCVNESDINSALVRAFSDAGVKAWMLTFANGTYSTKDLPEGWEAWRMKLRGDGASAGGYVYLCPNNPDYRVWKKRQVTTALDAHPFYGVDLCEPFFPAYNGPESEVYGCLCDRCKAAFRTMYDAEPPDFTDADSPLYWKTDKLLYEKWVGFRVASVVTFLDDLVNGKGGIREKCPNVKVATWGLGLDVPDQLAKLREWEAIDGAAIVNRVRPDMYVIQTDWPDWIKSSLSSKYPLSYKPVANSIKAASPTIPLMLQIDIGSKESMRRGRQWIREVESTAAEMGCESVTAYEYSIGEYMYTEPPAVVMATMEEGVVKLVFNKRLDAVSASNISNYTVTAGAVDYARVDGATVRLSVPGAEPGMTVVISGLSDDESLRLFHDKPACVMERSASVVVRSAEEQAVVQ